MYGYVITSKTVLKKAKTFKSRVMLGGAETHRQHTDLEACLIVDVCSVLREVNRTVPVNLVN